MVTRTENNGYQNQKRLLPEPKTIITRTKNDYYQNHNNPRLAHFVTIKLFFHYNIAISPKII